MDRAGAREWRRQRPGHHHGPGDPRKLVSDAPWLHVGLERMGATCSARQFGDESNRRGRAPDCPESRRHVDHGTGVRIQRRRWQLHFFELSDCDAG